MGLEILDWKDFILAEAKDKAARVFFPKKERRVWEAEILKAAVRKTHADPKLSASVRGLQLVSFFVLLSHGGG